MMRHGGGVIHRTLWRFARAVRASRAAVVAPDLSELLGRPAVNLDTPELQRFLAGKRVLVTGAGGSIGSEICRQAMKFCPQRLILLERGENSLFEIDRELRHQWVGADIRAALIDICDAPRVAELFNAERPQVIFHCAAHKHVPMMEAHPWQAIANNVFGTRTIADAAVAAGAAAFVMVSTDKAVNPTSVMGATKRFAELYIQSLSAAVRPSERTMHRTRFVAVRFGNVLGSNGSVVPIFARQIAAGGPVTVTHPDMRRFFMTIPEASQLVMQAGAIGKGGEIFVLDMGEPVRILELARTMIRRQGLEPEKDIAIRFTGIRPGEKLYEELANDDEQTKPTAHPKIRVWQLGPAESRQIASQLTLLAEAAGHDREAALAALALCIPEYRPDRRHVLSARTPALRLVTPASISEIEAA
jgi:FlaA1/EpsC-like NDP-sugar epimerase